MKCKTTPDPRGPLLITASFSALLAIWLFHVDEMRTPETQVASATQAVVEDGRAVD